MVPKDDAIGLSKGQIYTIFSNKDVPTRHHFLINFIGFK